MKTSLWRTIIISMMLLLNFGLCSAAVPADLAAVLNEYKDINANFDIELNYTDYIDLYRKAHVSTKRLLDNKPEYKEELDKITPLYRYIQLFWVLNNEHHIRELPEKADTSAIITLKDKYPSILNNTPMIYLEEYDCNGWKIMKIINSIVVCSDQQIKSIEAKYQ